MARILRIFGNSYLTGRRIKLPTLGFLIVRDLALRPFLAVKPRPSPDLTQLMQICVCKLDHLGDLLMAVPALQYLRKKAPKAEITLVVGEWAETLARFLQTNRVVDRVVVCSLVALNRGKKRLSEKIITEIETRIGATRVLRRLKLDIIFDLRPFSPNAWSLVALSGAKHRVGFGVRGMSFCYNQLVAYREDKSSGQLFLDAVTSLSGEHAIYEAPYLPSALSFNRRVLAGKSGRPYLVIQLYSAEESRNVPGEYWIRILEGLQRNYTLVLVGTSKDGDKAEKNFPRLDGMEELFGKTSIPELIRVVEESSGVVSVDSLSAHLGLAFQKRVAVLCVEGTSNRRSFPKENPDLNFFLHAETNPSEVIDLFCRLPGPNLSGDQAAPVM